MAEDGANDFGRDRAHGERAGEHRHFERLRGAVSGGEAFALYRHRPTGLRHFHIAMPDVELDAAVLAVPTPVPDDTGITHVLEHMALNGSRKFPVRGAFLRMSGRSLSTSMNALTTSDCTSFHFATSDANDFQNLLAVYLDAVFHPLLTPQCFAQEAHRLVYDDEGQGNRVATRQGVVLNEMRGAWTSPLLHLELELARGLFGPESLYARVAPGDPLAIAELDLESVRGYHASFYRPESAMLLTAGCAPAARHQETVHQAGLARSDGPSGAAAVGRTGSSAFSRPGGAAGIRRAVFPSTKEDTRVHFGFAWSLGAVQDPNCRLESRFIDALLNDDGAAPFASSLGEFAGGAPLPGARLDESRGHIVWSLGRTACEANGADSATSAFWTSIGERAAAAVTPRDIERALDAVERALRVQGTRRYPAPLDRLMAVLPAWRHGGDPFAHARLLERVEDLRESARDPAFARGILERRIAGTNGRTAVLLAPDPREAAKRHALESAAIARAASARPPAADAPATSRDATAVGREEGPGAGCSLPIVRTADLARRFGSGTWRGGAVPRRMSGRVWSLDAPANAACIAAIGVRVPPLEAPEAAHLPLYAAALGHPALCPSAASASVAGRCVAPAARLSARVAAAGPVPDADSAAPSAAVSLALTMQCLPRDASALANALAERFRSTAMASPAPLASLVREERARLSLACRQQPHRLAERAAGAACTGAAALDEGWHGGGALDRLATLDDALERGDKGVAGRCIEALASLAEKLSTAPFIAVVYAPAACLDDIVRGLAREFGDETASLDRPVWAAPPEEPPVAPASPPAAGVYACARAVPVPACRGSAGAALWALCAGLTQARLLPELRERGGAYGAGARFWPQLGVVSLFSFRDPRPCATLATFQRAFAQPALRWLQPSAGHPGKDLDGLSLSVIGGLREYVRAQDARERVMRTVEQALCDGEGALGQDESGRIAALSLSDLVEAAAGLDGAAGASVAIAS